MREVFLGLPGSWAEDNLEASDHCTTKIGGIPDWPFPESSLGPDMLQCKSCGGHMCLLSQVYAPLSSVGLKVDERVVYILGCTNAQCGSWRAIRVQKPSTCEESQACNSGEVASYVSTVNGSGAKWLDDMYLFDSEEEDYGDNEDMSLVELGRALSEAASLASGSAKKNVKKHAESNGNHVSLNPKPREVDASVFVLPCFYIYSEEDRSSSGLPDVCSSYSSLSIKETQYDKDSDDQPQAESWEEEGYEYDKALNADRTYLKFKKRVDASPEQCFRYSFGGKPLLASGQVGDHGACSLCGEARHYEMQLMPSLVYFLQEGATGAQKDLVDNWCWLTLLIYTCSKSCFQKADRETGDRQGWTVAEETVIAQFENTSSAEPSRQGYLS